VMVAKRCGLEVFEGDEWVGIGRDVGLREAKGLREQAKGVDRLAEALKLSHWSLLERAEVVVEGGSVRLRVYGCSARRALARWGLEEFKCTKFTEGELRGFMEGLELEGSVELVHGPPSPPIDGLSCEWLLRVRG